MDVRRLVRFPALVVLPLAGLVLTAGQCNGAPNRPPVADAGEDRTVGVGELVTLDGSASSDPDGGTLSFAWQLQTVPDGSGATLSDADTPTPSFTPDTSGEYVATLTVSDGELDASDSVSVTASEAPNEAPSLSSIDDQRTPMNEPIEVPFTISDEDPDSVTFEASSSDTTLVADVDLEVLGGGAERLLRIAPAPMGLGAVTITLVAQDPDGLEDSTSFALNVTRPFDTQFPKLTANDAAEGDQFGRSVAISGDYALIGAYGNDDDGTNSGAGYVFQRSGDTWNQTEKLTANDAAENDLFGRSVAISGDYALIGAYGNDDDGTSSGAAYAYLK